MDPWVFRCVLDGEPRRLVVALSEKYFLSYDLDRCVLDKVWKPAEEGGVELTGPVYDHRHGPQPKSRGEVLYEAGEDGVWKLERDGKLVELPVRFVGYSVTGNVAVLHYATDVDGVSVEIRDSTGIARGDAMRVISMDALPGTSVLHTPSGELIAVSRDAEASIVYLHEWLSETDHQ